MEIIAKYLPNLEQFFTGVLLLFMLVTGYKMRRMVIKLVLSLTLAANKSAYLLRNSSQSRTLQMGGAFRENIYKYIALDSVAISFIYLFSISFGKSILIYLALAIKLSANLISILIILFLLTELRLLFFKNIIQEIPTLDIRKTWRSWPTIGMVFSLPLAFIYYLFRFRDINMFGYDGVLVVLALLKYNILNPCWIRSKKENKRYNGGFGRVKFNIEPHNRCTYVELGQPHPVKTDV